MKAMNVQWEFSTFFSHSEIIYVSRRYNEDTKLSMSMCI